MKILRYFLSVLTFLPLGALAQEPVGVPQFAVEARIDGVDLNKMLSEKRVKYSSGFTILPRSVTRPGNEVVISAVRSSETEVVSNSLAPFSDEIGISLVITPDETVDGGIQFSGTLKIAAEPGANLRKTNSLSEISLLCESSQRFRGICRPSEPVELAFFTTEGKRATMLLTITPLDVSGSPIR